MTYWASTYFPKRYFSSGYFGSFDVFGVSPVKLVIFIREATVRLFNKTASRVFNYGDPCYIFVKEEPPGELLEAVSITA